MMQQRTRAAVAYNLRIAMLATFLTPPGAFSYKTAFDERYARFSPGVLLQRENLAILQRDGIAWTDSCAAADHPMIDHIWRERLPLCDLMVALRPQAPFWAAQRLESLRNAAIAAAKQLRDKLRG